MDVSTPAQLPLVPEATLRKHGAFVGYDTRFRACARLLQSLHREALGLPMGGFIDGVGKRRRYGHLVSQADAAAGANFLNEDILRFTSKTLAYREPGALIEDRRVYGNLLASMPLAFNLFGALKLDGDLADRWVREVYPAFEGKVSHIQFEHSPGRGESRFTDDGTAFDVFISLRLDDGRKAFLAIEVKYSEGMTEAEPRMRPRYDALAEESGLFENPQDPDLRRNPFQQLWRQHMLAQAMVMTGLYDTGALLIIAPEKNGEVQRAAARYQALLAAREDVVTFEPVTLERAIAAVALAGDAAHAAALTHRYTDFGPVHALI